MSHDLDAPIRAAILGTDALLASRPADPVQVTHACQRLGFDLVVPVAWGEELIATFTAGRMGADGPGAVVISSCPFVDEELRDLPVRPFTIRTISPPVACARYLRAAFHPRAVHVTYVGACPGAASAEVDEQLLPDVLFARLVDQGIDLARQPRHFDGQLPPGRARHASLPGGAPEPAWLRQVADAMLVEAAPATALAVAMEHLQDHVVIDLGPACGCACARDRFGAAHLEPPRATSPVVLDLGVPMIEEQGAKVEREIPALPAIERGGVTRLDHPARDARVTFAENGFSSVEAEAPARLTGELTEAVEPWI